MNQKQDYIKILEFGKDVTQHMKWKGNPEITVFFRNLYSQQNFDNAIKIIKKDNETSRNIISVIQKIEELIFSGKYKDNIQFLINQLNNKQLRDQDVLKALENRLRRYFPEQILESKRRFKFGGGKSKKHKKRGTTKRKTRKIVKIGGLLSGLNPFRIFRSRSANVVVPTDTDQIGVEFDEEQIPSTGLIERIQQHELQEYQIPPELNNFNNIIQFNSETGNYEFSEHGDRVWGHNYNSHNIDSYRTILDELNSKKLNCKSNFKTGFVITRWTLFIIGILLGVTTTVLMPIGVFGFFSVGLLFAMLFGIPVSGVIISGAILSVERYIIDKYCISSANKRNAKRDAELREREAQFQNPEIVQTEEQQEVEADAFDTTPVYIPNTELGKGEEKEKEEEKDNNPSGPYNKFFPQSATPLYPDIKIANRKWNDSEYNNEPQNITLKHTEIKKLIAEKKRNKNKA